MGDRPAALLTASMERGAKPDGTLPRDSDLTRDDIRGRLLLSSHYAPPGSVTAGRPGGGRLCSSH